MSKGTWWKMSVVSRVSMMPVFSRVSVMSEGYSAAAMVLCFGGGRGAQEIRFSFEVKPPGRCAGSQHPGLCPRPPKCFQDDDRKRSGQR